MGCSAPGGPESTAAIGNEGDSDPGRRLAFWQNRYFVSLNAAQPVPDETLQAFAQAIVGRLPAGGARPALVDRLPSQDWSRQALIFFHEEMSIQMEVWLGGENMLGLSQETNGVVGRYELGQTTARLMLVEYPASGQAAKGLKALQNSTVTDVLARGCPRQPAWGRFRQSGCRPGSSIAAGSAEMKAHIELETLAAGSPDRTDSVLCAFHFPVVRRPAAADRLSSGRFLLPHQSSLGAHGHAGRPDLDPPPGLGALIIVGLTVLIGRVWCGWICPFGSLLEWVSFRKARQRAKAISPHWRTVKYILLVVILVGAIFGNLTLLIFEPLALLTRAMTTVVIPALNYSVNAAESTLYSFAFMRPAISWLEADPSVGPILAGRAARIRFIAPGRRPVFRHSRPQPAGGPVLVPLSLSIGRVAGLAVEILHPAPSDRADLHRLHPLRAFVQTGRN